VVSWLCWGESRRVERTHLLRLKLSTRHHATAVLSRFRAATQVGRRELAEDWLIQLSTPIRRTSAWGCGWLMQKVIAYQDRAEEWRRRTSEETNAQQREANERIATVWKSLARLREKQLKEGTARPVF
jgi:hypothetical protein